MTQKLRLLGVAVLSLLLLTGCAEQRTAAQSGQAGSEVQATVEDVADNPEEYTGRTTMVRGYVSEMVAPGIFTMDENLAIGNSEMLVMGMNPDIQRAGLRENDAIVVVGPVGVFHLEEYEQQHGTDLDDDIYGQFEDLPMISAQSVQRAVGKG